MRTVPSYIASKSRAGEARRQNCGTVVATTSRNPIAGQHPRCSHSAASLKRKKGDAGGSATFGLPCACTARSTMSKPTA